MFGALPGGSVCGAHTRVWCAGGAGAPASQVLLTLLPVSAGVPRLVETLAVHHSPITHLPPVRSRCGGFFCEDLNRLFFPSGNDSCPAQMGARHTFRGRGGGGFCPPPASFDLTSRRCVFSLLAHSLWNGVLNKLFGSARCVQLRFSRPRRRACSNRRSVREGAPLCAGRGRRASLLLNGVACPR